MMNFPDAPTNGQTFSNYKWDGEKWMPLPATFVDAPVTGKIYGRKDQTWAEIISDVTKAYVDTEIAKTVKKVGDTMSGALTLSAGGTVPNLTTQNNTQIANTNYVETRADAYAAVYAAGRVAKTGDTMSGALALSAGGTVPDLAAQNTTWIANTNYVEARATAWAAQYASGKINRSGDTMSGALGAPALNMSGLITTCKTVGHIAWNSGGSQGLQVIGNENSNNHAIIEFHRPNSFACNFGLSDDSNFWFGGWSFGGGVWYKLWSQRDFGEYPVHNTRLVYVGDYVHSSDEGLTEPYGASACQTGGSGANLSGFGGSWLTQRYRQLQVRQVGGYYNSESG